jgi:UDP-N-acetylglucosamine 2-epimerase
MQQDSLFIISDSGTAQEEPALLNVPVVVPRDFTERPESIQSNCSFMLKMSIGSYESSKTWLRDKPASETEWLGDGKASEMIVSILKKVL